MSSLTKLKTQTEKEEGKKERIKDSENGEQKLNCIQ